MIGVIVTFEYQGDFDRHRIINVAEKARAMFEGMPGLRFKFFTFDEQHQSASNFYVWESREAAEGFFFGGASRPGDRTLRCPSSNRLPGDRSDRRQLACVAPSLDPTHLNYLGANSRLACRHACPILLSMRDGDAWLRSTTPQRAATGTRGRIVTPSAVEDLRRLCRSGAPRACRPRGQPGARGEGVL